jgi:glycosyltransferase involved in cell wall biosynthesis
VPQVSVIVPTHNRARLLAATLRSITRQRGVDLEVVVVDDASTDDTAALVAALDDARVRIVRNPVSSGVSTARNTGIANATGEWIAFCDDDDLWAPDKLETQLAVAQVEGATWVYTGDVTVDSRLRVVAGSPPPSPREVVELLPRQNPLSSGGSNVLVRASALAVTGGFDTALRRTEDWDLWLRLVSTGPLAWVQRPLVAYRLHQGNIVSDVESIVLEATRLAQRRGVPVDMSAMHRRAAWTLLRGGRRREAVAHYLKAVRLGDVRSLVRAGFALTSPAVGTDSLLTRLGRDPVWIVEAERWLSACAETSPAGDAASSRQP